MRLIALILIAAMCSAPGVEITKDTIREVSIAEIKAWLKKDDKERYLASQLRVLEWRPCSKEEMIEIFGPPTVDNSRQVRRYLSWGPLNTKNGLRAIEDESADNGDEEKESPNIFWIEAVPSAPSSDLKYRVELTAPEKD